MLVVLDGFGLGDGGPDDATAVAHGPFFQRLRETCPSASVETSGEVVGLPAGQMGNSEVGHMTMGAGRVIEQDLTAISHAISRGELDTNSAIQELFAGLEGGGTLHLMGLLSDGGVHSHQDHLYALLEASAQRGIDTVVHVFLDGRDCAPTSGLGFVKALMPHVERTGARVATVSGRYYAMDRDDRWDRVGKAYAAIVCAEGASASDPVSAVEASYEKNENDEFVVPTVIDGGAPVKDGDAVFFFNFRSDRARELTNAISGAQPERFEGQLERGRVAQLAGFLCMTEYDADFGLPVAFPPSTPRNVLGEVVARADLSQLRMAGTEKYAHVTFFFNSGLEEPFPGEDRILVPSPRDVPTYDHKPEMSARAVTDKLVEQIEQGDYAFILVNYANPDMVGHTGVLSAAVKAVEAVDHCLARAGEAVLAAGGQALITADHGNCELMRDRETGEPHTAHTTNPVPLYWLTRDSGGRSLRDGGLADLAPTVLELMGLPIPDEMSGRSLIEPASDT
jgi:2,3-bisphosphoglycerate-independent phosphoglycerate mutase